MTMLPVGEFSAAPELGYGEWRAVVRSIVGRHNPEGIEPKAFKGRVSIQKLFGFCADLWDHNAHRIERTRRDVRLDDVEFYHAVFQLVGRSMILQNDEKTTLDVGDVALVDSTRPVTYVNDAPAQWLSLQLPRRSLISHLGQEPRGGSGGRRGTRAGHFLYQLVLNEFKDGSISAPVGIYMQLAVYDLIGELFTTSDVNAVSPYTDQQFGRLCAVIKDRFGDPDLRPRDVAAAVGISLRYLQKLFAERGSTYSHFVESLRLDHASRLLRRRMLANTHQPISEICYASGFNDYNYFSRRFRRRFGYAPSAHAQSGSSES